MSNLSDFVETAVLRLIQNLPNVIDFVRIQLQQRCLELLGNEFLLCV